MLVRGEPSASITADDVKFSLAMSSMPRLRHAGGNGGASERAAATAAAAQGGSRPLARLWRVFSAWMSCHTSASASLSELRPSGKISRNRATDSLLHAAASAKGAAIAADTHAAAETCKVRVAECTVSTFWDVVVPQ